MNQLIEWISRFFSSWKFWVIVPPWDIGVRVRLGRKAISLYPGPHFRIPVLDDITLVNTRLRVATTPPITVQARDKDNTRVVTATIGFKIIDPVAAIMSLDKPEMAVQAFIQAEMSQLKEAGECLANVASKLKDSGIEMNFVRYVENVEVQTFRLLQNSYGSHTDQSVSAPMDRMLSRY